MLSTFEHDRRILRVRGALKMFKDIDRPVDYVKTNVTKRKHRIERRQDNQSLDQR